MRSFAVLLAAALVVAPAIGAQASAPAPASAPDVGQMAPDFTAAWADSAGPRAEPVKLSDLRGKVVVLAFYPADRSRGCTIELTKFRDDYQLLFGADVVVLPVSVDSMSSHVSWAHDMKFPFALVTDPSQAVATQYGSTMAGRPFDARTVYVIGRDGKIVYRNLRFGALDEHAYTELRDEVAKARG